MTYMFTYKSSETSTRFKTNKVNNWSRGQCLHIDFAFINKQSIQGFTSYLSTHCITTKYDYVFPTRNKRLPVDMLSFFIHSIRQQNINIQVILTDEGGELARSTAFLKFLLFHHSDLDTTSSYTSFLNKDERGHRTNLETIKSMLYDSNLGEKIWCFASQYSVFVRRCFCSPMVYINTCFGDTGLRA